MRQLSPLLPLLLQLAMFPVLKAGEVAQEDLNPYKLQVELNNLDDDAPSPPGRERLLLKQLITALYQKRHLSYQLQQLTACNKDFKRANQLWETAYNKQKSERDDLLHEQLKSLDYVIKLRKKNKQLHNKIHKLIKRNRQKNKRRHLRHRK